MFVNYFSSTTSNPIHSLLMKPLSIVLSRTTPRHVYININRDHCVAIVPINSDFEHLFIEPHQSCHSKRFQNLIFCNFLEILFILLRPVLWWVYFVFHRLSFYFALTIISSLWWSPFTSELTSHTARKFGLLSRSRRFFASIVRSSNQLHTCTLQLRVGWGSLVEFNESSSGWSKTLRQHQLCSH